MNLLIYLVLLMLIIWAFERFYLRGPRPGEYPKPDTPDTLSTFTNPQGPGEPHEAVVKAVRELTRQISFGMRRNDPQAAPG